MILVEFFNFLSSVENCPLPASEIPGLRLRELRFIVDQDFNSSFNSETGGVILCRDRGKSALDGIATIYHINVAGRR